MKKKSISQICHECEDLYYQLVKHDTLPLIRSQGTHQEEAINEAKEYVEMAWHKLRENFRIKRRKV